MVFELGEMYSKQVIYLNGIACICFYFFISIWVVVGLIMLTVLSTESCLWFWTDCWFQNMCKSCTSWFFSDILKQKSVNLNLLFGYFEAKFGTNLSRKLAKIVIKIKFFAWFFYTKDDVITIYMMVFIILIYMNIILFDFYGTKMVNNKSIYRHLSLK